MVRNAEQNEVSVTPLAVAVVDVDVVAVAGAVAVAVAVDVTVAVAVAHCVNHKTAERTHVCRNVSDSGIDNNSCQEQSFTNYGIDCYPK